MDIPSITHLTSAKVAELDPYAFLAVLGKRVIHPPQDGLAHAALTACCALSGLPSRRG